MASTERPLLEASGLFDFSSLDDIGSKASLDLHSFDRRPLQEVDSEIKAILALEEQERERERAKAAEARETLARRTSALSIPPLAVRGSKASIAQTVGEEEGEEGVEEEGKVQAEKDQKDQTETERIPLPPSPAPSPRRLSSASAVSTASHASAASHSHALSLSMPRTPTLSKMGKSMSSFSNLFRKRTTADLPPTPSAPALKTLTPPHTPVPMSRSTTLKLSSSNDRSNSVRSSVTAVSSSPVLPELSLPTTTPLVSAPTAPTDPLPSTPTLAAKTSQSDSLKSLSTTPYPSSVTIAASSSSVALKADSTDEERDRDTTLTRVSSTPVSSTLKLDLDLEIGSSSFLDDFKF